jgi:cell shape-determining protein MreD
MIKLIVKIAAIFLAVILQVTLMPLLSIKGMWPNLILITALILVLSGLKNDALLVAAIGGLLWGFFSPLRFGLDAIIFIGLVLLLAEISKKYLPAINLAIVSGIIFSGSLFYGLLMSLFLKRWVSWELLIDSVYATLLGLIFFLVLNHFQRSKKLLKVTI